MSLVPVIDLANHRTPQRPQIEPVQIDLDAEVVRLVAPHAAERRIAHERAERG